MADWERPSYASPGDLVHWPSKTTLTRPFFYTSRDPSINDPLRNIIDDPKLDAVSTVKPNTRVLIVASFPEGTVGHPKARGAIVLVPDRGLWWWGWP